METGCTVSPCLTGQTDLNVIAVTRLHRDSLLFTVFIQGVYRVIHCQGFLLISCHRLPSVSSPLRPPLPAVMTHSQAQLPKICHCQFRVDEQLLTSHK